MQKGQMGKNRLPLYQIKTRLEKSMESVIMNVYKGSESEW